MHYYAFINANSICEGTYGFPSQITDSNYIYLGTQDDQTVIGKKWTGTEWVEVVAFYYAVLNEKDICVDVIELPSEITDYTYIRINTFDETLEGKWYNRVTLQFETAPIRVLADHSSDVVNYRNEDKWLSDKIDEKANSNDVYTKAESDAKFALIGAGGTSGANGLSAYELAVQNGYEGTVTEWLASLQGQDGVDGVNGLDGTNGVDGVDGLSAYQIAVNNGFVGTEQEWLTSLHGADGTSASVTADDVLAKIKTVDGANSGLDADTLDGLQASAFAPATHTHTEYATTAQLDGKANSEHTHTNYATVEQLNGKSDVNHSHDGYAVSDHSHSDYATVTALNGKADVDHVHSGYAPTDHEHTISDVAGLQSALNDKASSSHTHSGYASSSHSHSDYFSKSGGTINGDTSINGVVRVNGQQCIFNSGSMVTLGTNNLQTMIAGSAIYSKVGIQVSSDERLKNVKGASDKDKALNLIKGLKIVDYAYKDAPNIERVGVIAQELQKLDDRFVEKAEDGYLYVKMSELIYPLILVVQELLKNKK